MQLNNPNSTSKEDSWSDTVSAAASSSSAYVQTIRQDPTNTMN